MSRLARLVIPGIPHHVTQRGNRGEPVFFEDGDYALYLDLLAAAAKRARVAIWAYCLMPNHVHIILMPSDEQGLWRTFGDLHRRYTKHVNARLGTTGHVWQGRFGSVAMDNDHLLNAVRYGALNPVRARLVDRAGDWRWSSAAAHLAGRDDRLVRVAPVLQRVGDFAAFLDAPVDEDIAYAALRRAEGSGRPVGTDTWLRVMEMRTGRTLVRRKPGPKPKAAA